MESAKLIFAALGYRLILIAVLVGYAAFQFMTKERADYSVQNYSATWAELPEEHRRMIYFTCGMFVVLLVLKWINRGYEEPQAEEQRKMMALAEEKARMAAMLEQEE